MGRSSICKYELNERMALGELLLMEKPSLTIVRKSRVFLRGRVRVSSCFLPLTQPVAWRRMLLISHAHLRSDIKLIYIIYYYLLY